jgi:hypothetical protein
MSVTIRNLTSGILPLPHPLTDLLRQGEEKTYTNVSFDDVYNSRSYVDLIARGIITLVNDEEKIEDFPEKVVTAAADIVLIEDSAAAYSKKKVQLGNLVGLAAHAPTHKGGGTDVIDSATVALAGLMSATDKTLLDEMTGGQFFADVRNETGVPIPRGTLIASIGWSAVHSRILAIPADKDNPARRPALGVAYTNIPNNTNGRILVSGPLDAFDTTAYNPNDVLVLGSAGAFSLRPPVATPFTGEIDIVGTVINVGLLDGIIQMMAPLPSSVSGEQAFALQGTVGTPGNANRYVTDTDPRLDTPPKYFRVAPSGGDYTSIRAAVVAATAAGASAADPYAIHVFPGTYVEDPMAIIPGISVVATFSNRIDTAFVVAHDPAQDLFTCAGGYLAGLRVSGVTDPTHTCFRLATAGTLTVFHGVGLRGCSNGIVISNGALGVMSLCSAALSGAGQEITTVLTVTGAGSTAWVANAFFSVPAALLPLYVINPIQTCAKVQDGAEAYFDSCVAIVSPKNATADIIFADTGAFASFTGGDVQSCGNFLHIGSSGLNTKISCSSTVTDNNLLNVWVEAATGVVFGNFTTDQQRITLVPGARESGIVQYRDDNTTKIRGEFKYRFTTDKDVDIKDYFADYTATGICAGGVVTAGVGLSVNVALGDGWIRRSASDDAFWVDWSAGPVVLDNNTTNYVVYDSATSSLRRLLSPPGDSAILLATVITVGGAIRYLHSTRTNVDGLQNRIQDYLLTTRHNMMQSGITTTVGTGPRKFSIGAGSYYLGLDSIDYAGAVDATFSYFWGTDGANEAAGSGQVSITQWDNAGILQGMTGGWFRADTVYITSDGRVAVIYGNLEYAGAPAAAASTNRPPPTFIEASSFPVAKLIVQEANGITQVIDIRPTSSTLAGAGGAVVMHNTLGGLLVGNDHSQYLLVSGTSPMTGDLDLDSNAIVNAASINGVDPEAHVARHQPGGLDPLTVGVPVAVQVGVAPDPGVSANLSRADHLHGIGTGVPATVGTANAGGGAATVSRSDHVHAHGNQIVDTLHAVAVGGVSAGFISAADQSNLDDLAAGHTLIPVRNETGAPIPRNTLVASAGWSAVHGCTLILIADKDDGARRPAIGVVHAAAIPDATNGEVLITGVVQGIDTSAWAITDQLVLGNAGAFSRPPPDEDPFTGEVQNVASVTRVNVADGRLLLIPDGMNAVTSQQIFALAGTSGVPSKINRYVTDADARNANNRAPTAHAVNHTGLGGDVIANATGADAGFMSAADFTKLGAVAAGATNTPLAITAPADVTKAVAVIGGSGTAAHSDHKHDISTAAPGTVTFGIAVEGGATSLARSDHTHAVTAPVAPTPVDLTAALPGASANIAREDHKHSAATGVPGTVTFAAAALEGGASTLARSDHTHQVPLPAAPADVTKAAADVGASANFARADHKHDVTTAAPVAGAVVIGGAAAEGAGTTLARSSHTHEVLAGVPVSVGTADAEGAAATFSRSNHVHAGLRRVANDFTTFVVKANPVAADVILIEDSAAAGAKKYATVSSLGPAATAAVATLAYSAANAADTLVTGMTLTPVAGTYLATFSGTISNATNGATTYVSLWYNGVQQPGSEQRLTRGNQNITVPFCCQAIITASGALAIEGRWRTTGGSNGTINQRTLTLIRVN